MSQVVSDPTASNEGSNVFANYIDYNYRLTLKIARRRVWRTCGSVGWFRCVFHMWARSQIIRRTLVIKGTFGDPRVLAHAGRKYFSHSPSWLLWIACVSSRLCKHTEKFLIIFQTHPFLCKTFLEQKWPLLLTKNSQFWLNTLFSSQLRQQYSIWGVLRLMWSNNEQCVQWGSTNCVLLEPAGLWRCTVESVNAFSATLELSVHEAEQGGMSKSMKL